jgi:Holliday junction resolvasome RuvABC endonuclease subunit
VIDAPIAVGIDLSLRATGVGVVGALSMECGRFGRDGRRDESLDMRLARIEELVAEIEDFTCRRPQLPLIAVLEAPATSAAGGSTTDRSALWWFTYKMLRGYDIPVVSVITQHLKIYATGKGNKLDKEEVLVAMIRRHPAAPIRNNDEADGLTLATMGARLIGRPVDGDLAKTYTRALDKIVVPEGVDVAPDF